MLLKISPPLPKILADEQIRTLLPTFTPANRYKLLFKAKQRVSGKKNKIKLII